MVLRLQGTTLRTTAQRTRVTSGHNGKLSHLNQLRLLIDAVETSGEERKLASQELKILTF